MRIIVIAMSFITLNLLICHFAFSEEKEHCNVCYNHSLKIATDGENIKWDSLIKQRREILSRQQLLNTSNKYKIPLISHHIWLTTEEPPQNIQGTELKLLKQTLSTLNSQHKKWAHYLWVDSLLSVPKSMLELKKNGIEIKEINHFNLPTLPLFNDEYNRAKTFNIGMANDIIKYLILKSYGGVYFDSDYELYSPLEDIHSTFNFYTSEYDSAHSYYISACLIGTSKNHPIINEALLLIKRNMNNITAPYYVKCSCNKEAKTVLATGTGMLSIAFYLKNNQNDNNDTLFTDNNQLYNHIPIPHSKIGKHYNYNSWKKEDEAKLFPYCTNCLKYQ